jgi:HAE1 family hydrophobic/amphiphilic exporter-1
VGTPVFGGMLAASVFGIFIIPLLFITAERLRRRERKTPTPDDTAAIPGSAENESARTAPTPAE